MEWMNSVIGVCFVVKRGSNLAMIKMRKLTFLVIIIANSWMPATALDVGELLIIHYSFYDTMIVNITLVF